MEFDQPYKLLTDNTSYFYAMVEQTGKVEFEHLREIAEAAATKKEDFALEPNRILPPKDVDNTLNDVRIKDDENLKVLSVKSEEKETEEADSDTAKLLMSGDADSNANDEDDNRKMLTPNDALLEQKSEETVEKDNSQNLGVDEDLHEPLMKDSKSTKTNSDTNNSERV